MLGARRWAHENAIAHKPWLILGKGPSFARYRAEDHANAGILALNHAARAVRCDAALMMDYDVFAQCGEAIAANARFVLMPWRPHLKFRAGRTTLADLVARDSRLAALDAAGRLIAFNAMTGARRAPFPDEPWTGVEHFSAEAALNLLADNGVARITTLGIDGGASYAGAFGDLAGQTLLANGARSFDRQFENFAAALARRPALQFWPHDLGGPARIFIGADETQALAAKVLAHSIKKHASLSVACERIDNADLPTPRDPMNRARTGFSFARLRIPELCGRQGRAIYLDADMLVFTDIRDLWSRPFGEARLLYALSEDRARRPQYSVMLLDCANLDWDARALIAALDSGALTYSALMHDFAMTPAAHKAAAIECAWNSLERYRRGRTKLLHYTDMPRQPWVSARNRRRRLWLDALKAALGDGAVSHEEIAEEVARGHVSPLLPQWIGLSCGRDARRAAEAWRPPHILSPQGSP
ncbi:MAG: glycosyltransferase [Hyphomonadaceae bacterium]